jgi:hypothetical protein
MEATLSAAVVVIAIGIALIGCANPVIVSKKPPTETPVVSAEEVAPLVGTTRDNGDGTYSLEFPLPESSVAQSVSMSGRSLVNYEDAGAGFVAAINYYQLIAVDDNEEKRNLIWASSSVDGARGIGQKLLIVVKPGETYHLLLLHGHKDSASDTPTLLGSGYIKYKVLSGANTIIIRMVPVLIDATITKTSDTTKWASET